jgi:hypothetical protein
LKNTCALHSIQKFYIPILTKLIKNDRNHISQNNRKPPFRVIPMLFNTYYKMKKILFVIAFCIAMQSHAQLVIPNGGFETWDLYNTWTLEPQYWETPNNQLVYSVIQDSSAYEGDLAMKVTVLPGFEGGVPQMASITIPADEYPEILQFAYKCNIPEQDPNDQVSILVECLNDDAVVSTSELVMMSSAPEWETTSMEIIPGLSDITEVRITVTAGYATGLGGGSWDTWISVDAMSFTEFNSVDESDSSCQSFVYPNPSTGDEIRLLDCGKAFSGVVEIFDILGSKSFTAKVINGQLNSNLASGVYIVSWKSESGEMKREKMYVID